MSATRDRPEDCWALLVLYASLGASEWTHTSHTLYIYLLSITLYTHKTTLCTNSSGFIHIICWIQNAISPSDTYANTITYSLHFLFRGQICWTFVHFAAPMINGRWRPILSTVFRLHARGKRASIIMWLLPCVLSNSLCKSTWLRTIWHFQQPDKRIVHIAAKGVDFAYTHARSWCVMFYFVRCDGSNFPKKSDNNLLASINHRQFLRWLWLLRLPCSQNACVRFGRRRFSAWWLVVGRGKSAICRDNLLLIGLHLFCNNCK